MLVHIYYNNQFAILCSSQQTLLYNHHQLLILSPQDDPNYVHSEDMGVEEQLKIGFAGHPNPFKANARHLQKQGRKEESGLVPESPKGQVMGRGAGPEVSNQQSGQHRYNLRRQKTDEKQREHKSTSNPVGAHTQPVPPSDGRKRPCDIGTQLSEEGKTQGAAWSPQDNQKESTWQQQEQPLRAGAPEKRTPARTPQLRGNEASTGGEEPLQRQSRGAGQVKSAPQSQVQVHHPSQEQIQPALRDPHQKLSSEQLRSAPQRFPSPNGQFPPHQSHGFPGEGYAGRQGESVPPQPPKQQFPIDGSTANQWRPELIPKEGQGQDHAGRQQRHLPQEQEANAINQGRQPSEEQFHAGRQWQQSSMEPFSQFAREYTGSRGTQRPSSEQLQGAREHGRQFDKEGGMHRNASAGDPYDSARNNLDLSNSKCALDKESMRTDPKHATDAHSSGNQSSLNFTNFPRDGNMATKAPAPAQISLASTEKSAANSKADTHKPSSKKVDDSEMSATENRLVNEIDQEIEEMAAEVQDAVSMENEAIVTMVHKPFDPNLVCPMCGKKHRIGEIQKFRVHVDRCEGD